MMWNSSLTCTPFFFVCRERDTTEQLIGDIDEVIAIVTDLVNGTIDWTQACTRLPRYTGTQNID